MSVTGEQSKVEADYTPKGTYTTLSDLKTYSVGDEDAKSAILIVYDIFGWSPQALQGADLLASQGFKVVIPDFLKGEYADRGMFDGSEEGNARRAKFFSGFPGAVSTQVTPFADATKAFKEKYSSVGALGFCWGYKVIVSSDGIGEVAAVASGHPSFAATSDADNIKQPLLLLPSKDEDMDVINKIGESVEKRLPGKVKIRQFPEDPHGFLGARGDLKSEKGKKSFSEGYTEFAQFFKSNL